MVTSYKDLLVWQRSLQVAEEVYRLTKSFPQEERFGLTSQIRRAAVSVPSNIAEGQARQSTAEFRQFLSIAQGSLAEIETQLEISVRIGLVKETDVEKCRKLITETSKMLSALRKALQKN